ncbi:peroxidase-like [Anticarsia gemmatalis]|uniref:peroxidase-like n=1 Tax=Anticarsia gemmatalis TaxID=129554 RepID=UPI003F760EE7
MLLFVIFLFMCMRSYDAVLYDCYTGRPVTRSRLQLYKERNTTDYCVIDVKPCDPNEGRRIDGSCNNLKYPSRGMVRTPTVRVLRPIFGPNYEPIKAKSGRPLPLPRYLRTQILREGKTTDMQITQLVSYYILFGLNDVNSIHDILNYALNTTYCCQPEGKKNYICAPNKIPVDDPVHRYSGIRCQNLTRPQSFQYFGCADFGTTTWARIVFATPVFDLSGVYSNDVGGIKDLRTYKNGELKIEIENGKIFPPTNPSLDPRINKCALNLPPRETRCHKHQINEVLGPNLFIILFYRQHNSIAKTLAKMNPCWNDEKIFRTAADINVAIAMEIYYYQLLPVIFGRKNMIRDGLISCCGGFRDLYEGIPPALSDEFVYMKRWFHTIQESTLKLYDKDGNFCKTFPIANLTTRTGFLPLDDNIDQLFQGSFRQLSGGFDYTTDSEMAERILGGIQHASDGHMNDLAKGRLFGLPPYVKYREFCDNRPYKSFDDLRHLMSPESIYRLRQLYDDVEDLDLMGATWAENPIPGGLVPHTVYCLMKDQLKRTLASDRHWYERPNRPKAFNAQQLQAIRRTTIAGLMCDHAESVTKIQPNPFYKISPKNPLTDCRSPRIGKINLSFWRDPKCRQRRQ